MKAFKKVWCAVATSVVLGVAPAVSPSAAAVQAGPVVTPVLATALTSPAPVQTSDNRFHLVYELMLTNAADLPVTIRSVEAVGAAEPGKVLEKLSGQALSARFKPAGRVNGPTATSKAVSLGPSQAGVVYLDVSAPRRQDLPRELVHRLSLSYPKAPMPGVVPASLTETAGKVEVSSHSVPVVAPPLTGTGWIDINGCCGEVQSHRGVSLALNQSLYIPQRFAIDFVRTGPSGLPYTGAADKPENWAGFGAAVHAVSDGTIVEAVDGLPEQKPFKPTSGFPLSKFTGNHVIQEFRQQGHTFYAVYAHLKTGSVKAAGLRPGQKITAGQQLALLGNTGNSASPHLHFNIMGTPDPSATDGLPYTFTAFTLTGRVPSTDKILDAFEQSTPVERTPLTPPQTHRNQLPMNLNVLTFPNQVPTRNTP